MSKSLNVIDKFGIKTKYSFKKFSKPLLYHEARAIDDSPGDHHTASDEGGSFIKFEKDVILKNFGNNLSLNELVNIRKMNLE